MLIGWTRGSVACGACCWLQESKGGHVGCGVEIYLLLTGPNAFLRKYLLPLFLQNSCMHGFCDCLPCKIIAFARFYLILLAS